MSILSVLNFSLAFIKSSITSTEKLSPTKSIVLILRPISSARNNSISSIFSKLLFFADEYFISAFFLKEIIDKCFLKNEFFFLNSKGIFALDK